MTKGTRKECFGGNSNYKNTVSTKEASFKVFKAGI